MEFTILVPLISTLVGGALALAGSFWARVYEQRVKRQSLLSAFRGEISTVCKLFRERGHLDGFKEGAERAKREDPECIYSFAITPAAYRVYEASISDIGLLKAPLPEQLLSFYGYLSALELDMADIRAGKYVDSPMEEKKRLATQLASMCEAMLAEGDKTVAA